MTTRTFVRLAFLILSIITIVLSIVLFSTLLFIIFSLFSNERRENEKKTSHNYQSLEYDSFKNETSFGIVTIYDELPKKGFLNYKIPSSESPDRHNQILISPIGSEEFECTGVCYCQQKESTLSNDDRRSIGISDSFKPLIYFVVAVSSLVAYNFAREYFEEECVKEFESLCNDDEDSIITSEVGECENVFVERRRKRFSKKSKGPDFVLTDPTMAYLQQQELAADDGEKKKFHCQATCGTSVSIIDYLDKIQMDAFWESGLSDMRVTRHLDEKGMKIDYFWGRTVVCEDLTMEGDVVTTDLPDFKTEENIYFVKDKFAREHELEMFCKYNSKFDEKDMETIGDEHFENHFKEKQDLLDHEGKYCWCEANEYGEYQNIQCRQIPII